MSFFRSAQYRMKHFGTDSYIEAASQNLKIMNIKKGYAHQNKNILWGGKLLKKISMKRKGIYILVNNRGA